MAFDLFPLQTIESRKRYYAKAIPEKWLTMFTHDPKTPWAYVEKDERGKMDKRCRLLGEFNPGEPAPRLPTHFKKLFYPSQNFRAFFDS